MSEINLNLPGYSSKPAYDPQDFTSIKIPQYSVNDLQPIDMSTLPQRKVIGGNGMFGGMFDGMDFLDPNGAGGAITGGLGAISSLYGAYTANKLGQEELDFQRKTYNQNYAAQKRTTNAAMEDRQRARVASNSGAYESVDSYMNKNRIA